MPVARAEPSDTRVIAHVDLDCFYVQVEQRRHPELKGKPTAVVMYNPWKGGGIIAVGYEARAAGVTRNMRGDDARKVCPEINLIQVPTHFGKADLTDYRDAGSEVVAVFSRGGVCERASIDEAYLDITEAAIERLQQCPPDAVQRLSQQVLGTHIVGLEEDHGERMEVKDWLSRSSLFASRSDQLLACGAMIIAELRAAVHEETGFTTSAGIAHNKMLAKLASGMHKPAQQTLIPSSGAPGLLASLPIKKLKGLGGKLGKAVESDLRIQTVGDLLPYSESKLQDLYGTNTGTWLWRVARGMSGDEVEGRTLSKSHGCGKTFSGPKALKDLDSVAYWLSELSGELQERLDVDLQQNNRSARLLVCHAACHLDRKGDNPRKTFPSKSCAIRYGKEKIAHDALILFKRALRDFCPQGEKAGSGCKWGVTALSLSANNIVDASGTAPITQYFEAPASTASPAIIGELVSVTTPPSSPPSSLCSSPLVSLSGAEHCAQQDRFGEPSRREKNADTEDLEARTSMRLESGISCSSSVQGLDDSGVVLPVGSLMIGGVGSTQTSNYPSYDSANTKLTMARISANETFEELNNNRTQKKLLKSDDDNSRHGQSYTQKGRAMKRIGNRSIGAEDNDLLCTPKFGMPSRPAGCLAALEFQEDLSRVCSYDSTLVQETVEGTCTDSETLAQAEVITCSPLEQSVVRTSERDSTFATEMNKEGDQENSERSSSFDQVGRSSRDVAELSPGKDVISVPGGEVSESVIPAVESHSRTVTLSSSLPASVQTSKIDDGTSGSTASQRVASPGSSKRLVFQRVDDLWEKSRSNTQPSLNATKSSIGMWNYKEDEIDESVLSELPVDIQHELRNQLRIKRPKTGGRSTINDFFKTKTSTANRS